MTTIPNLRKTLPPPPLSKRYLLPWVERSIDLLAYGRALTGATSLPDFLIVGAQKCGTTYLYQKLVEHPQVQAALRKEVHFFDNSYARGLNWYRGHFRARAADCISGEASPYYIFHPHAAHRIHADLPNVKLILLLREPVARANSHFHHETRMGYETLEVDEALALEENRLHGELPKMLADESYYSYNHQHFSYRAKGLYAEQVQGWMKLFAPEQLLILPSEEFYRHSAAVLRRVTDFLGLAAWDGWTFRAPRPSSYPPLPAELAQELRRTYHRPNQHLADLLGVDFGWNRQGQRS